MTKEQLLQKCKNEVVLKYGYSDYDNFFKLQSPSKKGREKIQRVSDEAAILFAEKMCEAQKQICANEARFTIDPYAAYIDKNSIINAPKPE